jgi:hypothetical protein
MRRPQVTDLRNNAIWFVSLHPWLASPVRGAFSTVVR